MLTPEEAKTLVISTLRSLYSDKSWRVRYVVAEKFVRVRCFAVFSQAY
jgi:serine/threonine-protein phosphatase 2A regulatory subunit A